MKKLLAPLGALIAIPTLAISLTACAPPDPATQASATAKHWLESDEGSWPGLELGTLGQQAFEGGEVGESRPLRTDSTRYRAEISYNTARPSGRAARGLIDVRVEGDGAPCVLAWNGSAPW